MEHGDCARRVAKVVALGILEPHAGACATPAFVAKQRGKPRGRLACNYRRANAVANRMPHPMPRVDAALSQAVGAMLPSSLDAVSGFSHLKLSARAKEVLAVCTSSGLYA